LIGSLKPPGTVYLTWLVGCLTADDIGRIEARDT
jgi:hypothetical protein